MKTKLGHFFPVLLLLLTVSFQIHAQGTAFTYQGRLNALSGPATGTYDFAFTIYDSSFAGNAVAGPVTNSAVSVSNGLFTTTIDFGSASFNGSSRWLEIAVSTNGAGTFFPLNPRQAFTPTPYSITAATITGPLAASQIIGTIPSAAVAGTYGNAVTFNNPNNQFSGTHSGDGTGLTNVNAAALNGLASSNFWQTGGNNVANGQFIGSTNNIAVEMRVGGKRAALYTPTVTDSPNITGGAPGNLIDNATQGAVIAGGGTSNYLGHVSINHVTGNFSTIGGGSGNWIQSGADHSFIGAGWSNYIQSGSYESVIAGGQQQSLSGINSTIGGGWLNGLSGNYSTIAGGSQNSIGGALATVGGGQLNKVTGFGGTVAGGAGGTAGQNAVVGGGYNNQATGQFSTVPGGYSNLVTGTYSFAAGNSAQATNDGAFVWADSQTGQFSSTEANQFLVRAQNGVGINTNNPNGSALNVNGNVNATSFSGDGGDLTNLSAAQLTGTVPSAQVSGTYSSALTLNNANNTFSGNTLTINGNKTGGWPGPVVYFNNSSTAANASPALRVTAGGATADGALNVSATGTGLIARFGNAVAFVADITTNGIIDANAFSGNGSALTGLNASQVTSGTLPSPQLSGTYSSAITLNNQSDNFTGAYNVSTNGSLRLNDRALYFRTSGDANHGLAYNGAGITNFGTGNVQVDGPVLWGFSGGALGVMNGGAHAALTWNGSSVSVTGDANVTGNLTATNMPSIGYTQSAQTVQIGNSLTTLTSQTVSKRATGYFYITCFIAGSFNNNTVYMNLYDWTSPTNPIDLAFTLQQGSVGSESLSWVVPVTSVGGSQTFTLTSYTDTGTATIYNYNLSVVFIPRAN